MFQPLRSVIAGAALVCAVFISGCATVTRGTSEQLMVQSDPSGAQVRLSNGFTGLTPATFTVPRKGTLIVTVAKDGYETAQVEVKAQLSGKGTAGFLGNAIIGGVIGGGIDVATGATLSHTPNPVIVSLRPLVAARPEPAAPRGESAAGQPAAAAMTPTESSTASPAKIDGAPAPGGDS